MGRKRIVTRDAILDAAEEVIRKHGSHQLSLQSVAAAANISKGSIAYNFRTKDALLLAVFAREQARFWHEAGQARATQAYETVPRKPDAPARRDPVGYAVGVIAAARQENQAMITKAAGLFTNMLQSETRREAVVESYGRLLDGIDVATSEGRASFTALMAVEGLFLLWGLGALRISESQWQEWLDIIHDTCLEKR